MGKRWQLQEAKNQLSRVVAEAREHGPQTITVHGEAAAVVLSAEEYRRLVTPRESLVEFFRRSPLHGQRLKVTRPRDTGRRRVRF
jgi:prevent-host-death family protein